MVERATWQPRIGCENSRPEKRRGAKNPRSRGRLTDENGNWRRGGEGNLGGFFQDSRWIVKRIFGWGGEFEMSLIHEFTQLDFRERQGVVFFSGSGFGDGFTKVAGVLAVEGFFDRFAYRLRPRNIANHFCPSDTLQNRQMPASGQKQSQPDHHGGNGSKNWKPMVHESGGLVSARSCAVNPAHPAK